MSGRAFHSSGFREQTRAAMETVRKILELTRNPRYAEDEDHTYDDKFGLAEFVTNSALAAQVNALERMGLDESKLRILSEFVHEGNRSVTLRFAAEETCEFVKEQEVEIESPRQMTTQVTETTTEESGDSNKTTEKKYHHKVITKVKEYHWKVGLTQTLFAFAGNDHETPVVLQSRESSTIIITTGNKQKPLPKREERKPIDVTLTWLLQNLSSDDLVSSFNIDRAVDTCRTPRRNDEIDAALQFFTTFKNWSRRCQSYICQVERNILGRHRPAGENSASVLRTDVSNVRANQVFVPVLPLMEAPKDQDAGESGDTGSTSPLLSVGDVNRFLTEQCRSLDEAAASLAKAHAAHGEGNLLGAEDAIFVMLCMHMIDIVDKMTESIHYIEQMLRDQLIAAIGKEVHQNDFEDFLRFHNQKLLGPDYAPKPFCYAIRRPNHYPDGMLSIEVSVGDDRDKVEPIESIVRKISGDTSPPMFFPINAATSVEFTGERYLHAWIQHRFASSPRAQPKLVARARQFSSFLLMVGTISGPDKFDPKDAIILQNKDEVLIPLLLNELPTPKEFKDAISSLSPEQQHFAKSFRGMQLASSVFGVCVVQLKPQLEVLLGLPPDALTKEIGLTQDLLSLFIEYQIPSDLLSFDGASDSPVTAKVGKVKDYVKKVQDVIEGAKTKQLQDEVKKTDMQTERGYGRRGDADMDSHFAGMEGFGGGVGVFGSQIKMAHAPPPSHAPPPPGAARLQARRCLKIASVPCAAEVLECEEEVADMDYLDEESGDSDDFVKPPDDKQIPRDMIESNKKEDFTAIPKKLNAAFDKHDKDNALRTTIIKTDKEWTRMRQENLLTKVLKRGLLQEEQKTEKNKAFDLLDALSRSGSLPIACAELHVVLGVTHCFENTVMGTVIEDNVNPIEKMEQSTLLIASTIHSVSPNELMSGSSSETARLASQYPPSALPELSSEGGVDA